MEEEIVPSSLDVVSPSESKDLYIPSDVEKKRIFVVYMLIGVFFLSRESDFFYSVYEQYHVHTAIGRRSIFIPLFFCTSGFFLFPYIRIPFFFTYCVLFVLLGYAIYSSQKGYYALSFGFYEFCTGLGLRILQLFDKKIQILDE